MTLPWPATPPSAADRAAFADAVVRPYWLVALPVREPEPRLEGVVEADLCIVGGGFTGLWAALHAVRRDPGRRVVVVEAGRCGEGASGRNGGFVDASLTHGLGNGLSRFADEMAVLERLGAANFEGLRDDLSRLGVECGFEEPGFLAVALEEHELAGLEEEAALMREYGGRVDVLDREAVAAEVHSPLYLGALWTRSGSALVDPGRLGDGLRRAAVAAGVTIYEHSPVHGFAADGA
jgi:glycine/D-amino acid oxidase-like deaminating enzyme